MGVQAGVESAHQWIEQDRVPPVLRTMRFSSPAMSRGSTSDVSTPSDCCDLDPQHLAEVRPAAISLGTMVCSHESSVAATTT